MVALLRAHWKFDGSYADSVQGLSASTATGTPIDIDEGPTGFGAYRFNNTRLYTSASSWDIAELNELTISFWAKPDEGISYGFPIRMGISADFNYGVTILGNIWRFEWYDSASTSFKAIATPSIDMLGEWQHVLITRSSSHYVKIYINGSLVAEEQAQDSPNATTFAFGGSNNANAQTYHGWLSDVRIYDDVVEDHVIERLSRKKEPKLELLGRWFTGRTGRFDNELGTGFDPEPISGSPNWVEGRWPGTFAVETKNGKVLDFSDKIPLPRTYSIHLWTEFPLSGDDASWSAIGRVISSTTGYPMIVQKSTGLLGVYANSTTNFNSSGFDVDTLSGWHSITSVTHNIGDTHIGWTNFYIDGEWVGKSDAGISPAEGIGELGGISSNIQSWGKIQDMTLWSGALTSRDIKKLIAEKPEEIWDQMDGSTILTLSQQSTEYLSGSDIINSGSTVNVTGDGAAAAYYGGVNLESNTGTASIDFDEVSLPAGNYRVTTHVVGDTTKVHLGTTQGGTDILNATASAGYSERTFTLGSTTTVYSRAHLDGTSEISRITLFSLSSEGAQFRKFDGATGGYLRLRNDATASINQKTKQDGYVSFFFRDNGNTLGPIASQVYDVSSSASAWKEGWRVLRTASGVEFELWDAPNGRQNRFSFTTGNYSTNGASNSYSIDGTDIELIHGEQNNSPLVVDMDGDLASGNYLLHKTNTSHKIRVGKTDNDNDYANQTSGEYAVQFRLDGTGPFFIFQYGDSDTSLGTADFPGLTLESQPYYSATTTDNLWHHCAVSWSRDEKKCRFYLDGVLVHENEFYGFTDHNVDFILNVGKSEEVNDTDDDTDRWNGDFDELKIGDSFLEGDRAREFWLRPILRLPLNGADSIEDISPYSRDTISQGGDPVTSLVTSPVGTGAIVIDDSTWYVEAPNDDSIIPAGQSFTVSSWMRFPATGNPKWSSGLGNAYANNATSGWSITHWNPNPTPVGITFYMSDGLPPNDVTHHVNKASTSVNRETWEHFTFVINREDGTIRAFIDGAFLSTTTFRSDFGWIVDDISFRVGQGNGHYTLADFSDYRVYNSVLTDEQVKEIFETRARLSADGKLRVYGIDTSGGEDDELLRPVDDPVMRPAVENASEYFESGGPAGLPIIVGGKAGDAQYNNILATSLSEDITYDGTSEYTTTFWAKNTLGNTYELGWQGDGGVMTNTIGMHPEWKQYSSTSTPTARNAERYENREAVTTITNYIRNPWFRGAERGTLTTGSSTHNAITNMLLRHYGDTIGDGEIIDVGEDAGQPFITVRLSGRNDSGGTLFPSFWMESTTHIPAATGTDILYTMELESKMDVLPADPNIRLGGHWRDSGGVFLGVPGISIGNTFGRTRHTFSDNVSVSNVSYLYPALYLVVGDGSSYDWTFTVWSPMATNQSSFTGVVLPPKHVISNSTGRLDITGLSMRKSSESPSYTPKMLNNGIMNAKEVISEPSGKPMRMSPGGVVIIDFDEEAP